MNQQCLRHWKTQQIKRTSGKGLVNIAVAQFKIPYNKHQEEN